MVCNRVKTNIINSYMLIDHVCLAIILEKEKNLALDYATICPDL